jgi:glycyl-tRNA synthetase alpha subunit
MSKGVYWILFAGAVAYGIFKVVLYVRKVNEVHDMEMQGNKYNNSSAYIITTDSTGKEDTMLLTDYLNKKKQTGDTLIDTTTRLIMPGTLNKSP